MIRFGKINTADPEKGRYRVEFVEDDFITAPLPYITTNTLDNKSEHPLDVGEPVAVLMDENCEDGVILGAYNDKEHPPVFANQDKSGITYKDGTFIQYDRAAKKLTVSCEGDIEVVKSSNIKFACSGTVEFNGGSKGPLPVSSSLVTRQNNSENKINALITAINTWVPAAGDGGAALKVALTAWLTSMVPVTTLNDIKNDSITQ